MPFFVYILLCSDGSFYTGCTKNLNNRIELHKKGKGARYTKNHKPQKVEYVELFESRAEALRRERRIKKMTHKAKQKLIIKNKYSTD